MFSYSILLPEFSGLAESLQQPIGINEDELSPLDGEKAEAGWYNVLHIAKAAILAFEEAHGRLPEPNNEKEADEVVALAKEYNRAMRALQQTGLH